MRTYEYKSITEGHKGADTRHDDDPGTSAEGNQQVGSVLDYSVGHPYRDPESVQYHEEHWKAICWWWQRSLQTVSKRNYG